MGLLFSAFCCGCQGLMCAGSCMHCCFRSATGTGGINAKTAKLFYIILLGVATCLALILRYQGQNLGFDLGVIAAGCSDFENSTSIPTSGSSAVDQATGGDGGDDGLFVYCQGDAAVMRISFVLFCFFSIMMGLSSVSEELFRGFWGFKIILFIGFLIGCFFIPNWFFSDGYAWLARIASALFLLLQILILIDFGYQWNEDWVSRAYEGTQTEYDEPTDKKWLIGVISCAAILYFGSIAGIVILFLYYTCSLGVAFSSVLLISVITFTVIALFREQIVGQPGSILPSAVVTAYSTYLTWNALESAPPSADGDRCGPDVDRDATLIVIGIVVATVSIMWTSFSATRNAENLVRGDTSTNEDGGDEPFYRVADGGTTKQANELDNKLENGDANSPGSGGGGGGEEAYASDPNDKHWLFFLLLTSAALYMAMLFTNWGVVGPATVNAQVGDVSMWVKIASSWCCILLYIWTLVAPAVMKGREFAN